MPIHREGGGGADFFWNSPINLVFIGLSILFHHIKNFQLLNRLLCGHNCFLFNSYTNECVFYTVLVFRCSSSAVPDVMINTEVWVPSTHSYQSDNWIDSQLVHGAGTISSHGRYQLTVALYLRLRVKFMTSMGFEPVTSRYRWDALTNWAMKPLMLGAGHVWVLMFLWGENQRWNDIWIRSYMNCGYEIKWSYDLCGCESNFYNCLEKPEKFMSLTGFEVSATSPTNDQLPTSVAL